MKLKKIFNCNLHLFGFFFAPFTITNIFKHECVDIKYILTFCLSIFDIQYAGDSLYLYFEGCTDNCLLINSFCGAMLSQALFVSTL